MVSIVFLRKFFVTQDVFSDAGLLRASPLPNIYINDLPQVSNGTGSHLFADDTFIFHQDMNA